MTQNIRKALEVFSAAWNAKDSDTVVACFSADGVYNASIGPIPGDIAQGHDSIRRLISKMFKHDAGAISYVDGLVISEKNASWRWRYELPSGDIQLGCDLFTFEGNLIILKDAYRKLNLLNYKLIT